ncbi:MAG: hypothetical protein QXX94_03540 [Candidatus Bathyarchaeia archaeon]
MSRNIIAIIFTLLMSLITILAVTFGSEFNWPDFVHIDYGFPLVWGTHTLNTFYGPVDIWRINPVLLVIDLIIWFCILIIGLLIILYVKR